jgi:iron complex transport system substrate-binding protein
LKKEGKIIAAIVIVVLIGGGTSLGIFMVLNAQPAPLTGYLFTDSKDRQVRVPDHPERIISMAPSITETLYELEVDDRLVGVTDYCNYPVNASTKTSIGGFSTPNMEVMVSLNPDLIISGTKGTVLMNKLTTDMESITNKTSIFHENNSISCYFEIWESPMVAGGSSFLDDMITKAGAINIFSDLQLEWPSVQHEWIIASDPDVIFITEHSAPYYSQDVCSRTGYNVVNACINARVYLGNDDIYLRTGPRIIMALENMTRYLYPFLFT